MGVTKWRCTQCLRFHSVHQRPGYSVVERRRSSRAYVKRNFCNKACYYRYRGVVPLVGIPAKQVALLVGGPDAGDVVKVEPGQNELMVVHVEGEPARYIAEAIPPEAPSPTVVYGRYKRMGNSINFKWEGYTNVP